MLELNPISCAPHIYGGAATAGGIKLGHQPSTRAAAAAGRDLTLAWRAKIKR